MKSLEELAEIRNRTRSQMEVRNSEAPKRIIVGMATSGIAAGARPVLRAIVDEVAQRGMSDVMVSQSGSIGRQDLEPIVEVVLPGLEKITYARVQPDMVPRIVEESLIGGRPVEEFTVGYLEEHRS